MARKSPNGKLPGKKTPAGKDARAVGDRVKRPTKKALAKAIPPTDERPVEALERPAPDAEASADLKAIKTPLSRKELGEFRGLLVQKRRTILGDMTGMEAEAFRASRRDASGDLSTMPVHMADIGTDNYEQEFTLGLLESERQLLREIDEALDRVEKGTYGVCAGTGKPISKARLKAQPWAKFCIEYARMIEQGLVRQPAQEHTPAASDEEGEDVAEEEEAPEEEVDIEDEVAAQEAEEDLSL